MATNGLMVTALQENKEQQIFRKTNVSNPHDTCAYQEVKNVCLFLKIWRALSLSLPPSFCLITNDLFLKLEVKVYLH